MRQVAGTKGNAGAAAATVAASSANLKCQGSLMAAVMEQSSYLDYSYRTIKKFHKQATRSLLRRMRVQGWIVLVDDCDATAAQLQLSSLDNYVRIIGSNILGLKVYAMEQSDD